MKKPNAAATAAADFKKTMAPDVKASGPETPAMGTEGVGTVEGGSAVAPPAETAEPPESVPVVAAGAGGPIDRVGWPSEIVIKGPEKGRWRAGRHFTLEPVRVVLAELSDDQLLALRGDPELTLIDFQ